jgi:hypothetical protein
MLADLDFVLKKWRGSSSKKFKKEEIRIKLESVNPETEIGSLHWKLLQK